MSGQGRLFVLEGGEGAGKTTQARLLARHLDALLTREPGGTVLGEHLRALLLDPSVGAVEPRAELLLMVAARAQHVGEVILPALRAGGDVVCDRFGGSTLAYQGYGRGLPIEEVRAACDLGAAGLVPDLTILVDVGPEIARSRRHRAPDRIEAEEPEFHERVRAGFRALAGELGWAVVDGEGGVDEIAGKIAALVDSWRTPAAPGDLDPTDPGPSGPGSGGSE